MTFNIKKFDIEKFDGILERPCCAETGMKPASRKPLMTSDVGMKA